MTERNGFISKWIMGITASLIVVCLGSWLTCIVYANNDRLNINSGRLNTLEESVLNIVKMMDSLNDDMRSNNAAHMVIIGDLREIKTVLGVKHDSNSMSRSGAFTQGLETP